MPPRPSPRSKAFYIGLSAPAPTQNPQWPPSNPNRRPRLRDSSSASKLTSPASPQNPPRPAEVFLSLTFQLAFTHTHTVLNAFTLFHPLLSIPASSIYISKAKKHEDPLSRGRCCQPASRHGPLASSVSELTQSWGRKGDFSLSHKCLSQFSFNHTDTGYSSLHED